MKELGRRGGMAKQAAAFATREAMLRPNQPKQDLALVLG